MWKLYTFTAVTCMVLAVAVYLMFRGVRDGIVRQHMKDASTGELFTGRDALQRGIFMLVLGVTMFVIGTVGLWYGWTFGVR